MRPDLDDEIIRTEYLLNQIKGHKNENADSRKKIRAMRKEHMEGLKRKNEQFHIGRSNGYDSNNDSLRRSFTTNIGKLSPHTSHKILMSKVASTADLYKSED